MKPFLTILTVLLSITWSTAQYATVNYDLQKNYFNDGQALPADVYLMFTGEIPPAVSRIELTILPENHKEKDKPLFTAAWQNTQKETPKNFQLPVNYGLKGSSFFDIVLEYYTELSAQEREDLRGQTRNLLINVLEANLSTDGTWELNEKKRLHLVEGALREHLMNYRNERGGLFTGFSEYLPNVLDVEKMAKDTSISKQEQRRMRIVQLTEAIMLDFADIFDQTVYRSKLLKTVDNYPTVKKQGYFSVNVGYAGIFLGEDYQPATYAASPYLGVSFPLSNRSTAANWVQNTAVLFGFFWQDLPVDDKQQVEGFLIEKPVLVGLDYKLFQFIRLNAGATFLETTTMATGADLEKAFQVRPFLGLSAKIDLSLGLGD